MNDAITEQNNWGLTEADDSFHPRDEADPLWTETMWFAFMVPERKLLGYIYPAFRQNLGIQFGGITINEGDSVLAWEMPIFHWQQYVPIEPGADLRNLNLPSGLEIKSLSPGRKFHITYDNDELTLDLTYDALMQPMLSGSDKGPFVKNGHLDQPGHVTGEMVMHGETIPVDCLAMRDRGWGPRRENQQIQMGYCYGTASATSAFLSVSGTGRSGKDKVIGGYHMKDGVWSKLASGQRQCIRDGEGRVTELTIEALDELGRELTASGVVESRMAYMPYSSMLVWGNLVRWTLEGETCWGEDQDCWGPQRWRDFARSLKS